MYATKVQRQFRRRYARLSAAAVVVQRHYRGLHGRHVAREFVRQVRAAVQFQRLWKGRATRRRCRVLRQERKMDQYRVPTMANVRKVSKEH